MGPGSLIFTAVSFKSYWGGLWLGFLADVQGEVTRVAGYKVGGGGGTTGQVGVAVEAMEGSELRG